MNSVSVVTNNADGAVPAPVFASRYVGGLPAVSPSPPVGPRFLFDGGHNAPELVPSDALARAADHAIRAHGALLARYQLGHGPLGFLPLRHVLADILARYRDIATSADNVLVTSGSGQGLDLVNATFVAPGDTVLVEEFTFHGAISRFRRAEAKLARVAVDEHGLQPEALAQVLTDLVARGVQPKFLYTIPTVQNPTGTILSPERRQAVLAVADQFDLMIVEDDCYADLRWGETRTAALYALRPDRVVYVGTLSKTLAPALRVGYVVSGADVLQQIAQSKRDGGTGALDQIVAAEYLAREFDAHLARLIPALERKMHVMAAAVREEFGTAAEFVEPEGGIFIWIRLPDGTDSRAFQTAATAAGITYNPGNEWTAEPDAGKSRIRLCFAFNSEQEIREGVARLAQLCFEATGVPARGANLDRASVR
ncbi:PLP-dependent aminotransferase family protein [Blastochloris viridis]|uniref:aminotransferase-like domain-containing protein n=1 Tax=Blastochloris viridis TaxID=1079 RepID=UPI001495406C|nr:PLP-dependent aminotransferase family protein [Blastochloris viridis]